MTIQEMTTWMMGDQDNASFEADDYICEQVARAGAAFPLSNASLYQMGVASLVFVRATMVSANFQNVRHQTEIQSMLWEQLHTNSSPIEMDGVQLIEENDELEDALMVYTYIGTDNKVIWKQQWLKDD